MVLRAGVVGCGDISDTYFRNAELFVGTKIVACANRTPERAAGAALRYGVEARSVEELLASDDIDIVVNLTPPLAHYDITSAALGNGKHVYSEKPVGLDFQQAKDLVGLARAKGLEIGVAPDTVLGAAVRTARRLIMEGAIGQPLFGTAAFMIAGPELFHPNPSFLYEKGGGPLMDMGPYYLATLIQLLGPVEGVSARSFRSQKERAIDAPGRRDHGVPLTSFEPTTVVAQLAFAGGVNVTFMASWDVLAHGQPHIEIHGTSGSLRMPNPEWFGGDILLAERPGEWRPISTDHMPLGTPNRSDRQGRAVADYRGVGIAELANALATRREPRVGSSAALHLMSVFEMVNRSSLEDGRMIEVEGVQAPSLLEEDMAVELLAAR